MIVTRQEYDRMVQLFPIWMSHVWTTFSKSWGIAGVSVFPPDDGTADELRNLLKQAQRSRIKSDAAQAHLRTSRYAKPRQCS